ncbi:MAG: sialate O-acetylesterase [bacterium]|nr:sialate O-acetylesterase [bacterium]
MPRPSFLLAPVLCAAILTPFARADVELPALFGDGMVLQRNVPVRVWGRAGDGEKVTVAFAGGTRTTTTGADGHWRVELDPLQAGGPHVLTVRASNTLSFDDVYVGDVWLGSGQSNMVMTVRYCSAFEEEAPRADLPLIRMFREASPPASEPQWRGKGRWVVCSPETVGDFSGVLYYFGRRVHAEVGVPIGLIESAMSATPIQCWISARAQHASPALGEFAAVEEQAFHKFDIPLEQTRYKSRVIRWRELAAEAKAHGKKPPRKPKNHAELYMRQGGVGGLFNGKIAPLIPYSLRGILWYQGENNVQQAPLYRFQLPLLIQDWRTRWGQGELPFAWVQLPNFAEGRTDADWALVREAMRRALRVPNTGMAVALDLGEKVDIHPRNKRDVGERLAAWALGKVYARDVATSGPLPVAWEVQGGRMAVRFDHAGEGLVVRGSSVIGFELSGEDGIWHPAFARAEGARVFVASEAVPAPRHVRYAWAPDPDFNLYNDAGLPASPFTSEDMPDCRFSHAKMKRPFWYVRLASR